MKATIRRNRETQRLELFFYNSNPRRVWLECFDRNEGHSEVSIEYMRKCEPVDVASLEARELRDDWERIGPDRWPVDIVQRLQIKVTP